MLIQTVQLEKLTEETFVRFSLVSVKKKKLFQKQQLMLEYFAMLVATEHRRNSNCQWHFIFQLYPEVCNGVYRVLSGLV